MLGEAPRNSQRIKNEAAYLVERGDKTVTLFTGEQTTGRAIGRDEMRKKASPQRARTIDKEAEILTKKIVRISPLRAKLEYKPAIKKTRSSGRYETLGLPGHGDTKKIIPKQGRDVKTGSPK